MQGRIATQLTWCVASASLCAQPCLLGPLCPLLGLLLGASLLRGDGGPAALTLIHGLSCDFCPQYLSSNVVALRLKTGVLLGDGEAGSVRDTKHKAGASDAVDEAKLKRAIRAHANFAESTPFTFFLIFLAELNGAPTSLVHGAFTTLFLARVAHGSIGVTTDNTLGVGRPIGAATTLLITAAAGLYNVSD